MGRILALLAISGVAQVGFSTFTDPAGRFQFRYPAGGQVLTGKRIAESLTRSYMPLCKPESIVCAVGLSSEFGNTNIEGASFQLGVIAAADEQTCLKQDGSGLPPYRTVNGIRFTHASKDEAAAGHSLTADLYRTFRQGACYEIRLSTAEFSIAIAPSGTRKVSTIEVERLQRRLDGILDSLRFAEESR
jgi:hypothetical protein